MLASQVNRQIADEGYSLQVLNHSKNRSSLSNDPDKYLRSAISLKLGEGDFTRAVHLASSRDSLAAVSDATFSTLQAKHPLPYPASNLPPSPDSLQDTEICVVSGG